MHKEAMVSRLDPVMISNGRRPTQRLRKVSMVEKWVGRVVKGAPFVSGFEMTSSSSQPQRV